MKTIIVDAKPEKLCDVIRFIEQELNLISCRQKEKMAILIAIEEIFVNIANYAYNSSEGLATVCFEVIDEPICVIVKFLDNGNPYNPLERDEPDIVLSAEEREIGGLGIFIVKKTMDSINYEYKDGKNILTIKKNLDWKN